MNFMRQIYLTLLLLLTGLVAQAQSVILNENFNNGIPATWTVSDQDGNTPVNPIYTDAWVSVERLSSPGDSVAASTSYYQPAGTSEDYLITHALPLGAFGNILSWHVQSTDASYPDGYVVLLSTTDKMISSFTDTIYETDEALYYWDSIAVNLEDLGYVNQTVYVAFVNNTYDGYGLMIDNVYCTADDASGIQDFKTGQLKFYPNPVRSGETIQIKHSFDSPTQQVEIIDITGKIIESTETQNNSFQMPSVSKGTYIIKVSNSEGIFTKKVYIY